MCIQQHILPHPPSRPPRSRHDRHAPNQIHLQTCRSPKSHLDRAIFYSRDLFLHIRREGTNDVTWWVIFTDDIPTWRAIFAVAVPLATANTGAALPHELREMSSSFDEFRFLKIVARAFSAPGVNGGGCVGVACR
jgi:hypothetical protein